MTAIGAASLGIGMLNVYRGFTVSQQRTMNARDIRMLQHNPTLEAYKNRRGSHLSGRALQDRNMNLFQV